MSKERLFGLVRYRKTEDGDRLTEESVRDTVHVGMTLGAGFALLIASSLFHLLSTHLGQTIGIAAVVVFASSWIVTTYFAYPTVIEKVEEAFRKHGEFYEGND